MLSQHSRTELLLGRQGLELLQRSRVAVFGLGGVGSYAVEALVRAGVGAVDLVDDDVVCLTNLNRQLIALRSTVGQSKAEAMAARVADINPDCRVTKHPVFFDAATADQFDFSVYSYVVDAIDTVSAKLLLIQLCAQKNTPILSCMGTGNKLDPTRLELADIYQTSICPLARVMRRELRRLGIPCLRVLYSKEPPLIPLEDMRNSCKYHCVCPPGTKRNCTIRRQVPGSVSFVPPVAGMILAGEVVKQLTAGAGGIKTV
ncbi:MAG: tRNA threonylcarbamoyladenosine dehydratase [Oscillospiraceae bacterium]|jgi:tRNA A37 threonylcarbamoyladenosine dehydratase|nr:tRNA threonylcarbamoyladenosine dehydratase [Oscillospiraceae bacterium]